MKDLTPYYSTVENVISGLGLSPANCRTDEAGLWTLRKGSAVIDILVWYSDANRNAYIRIASSLMPLPAVRRADMYEELLRYNMDFIGITFSINDNAVVLKTDRELEGLDENELNNMLTRIGNVADEYDNILQDKYKA